MDDTTPLLPRTLSLDLKPGEELLAVATIALGPDGDYQMHIADVVGASRRLDPDQKAKALRILATGVEAEAIARRV